MSATGAVDTFMTLEFLRIFCVLWAIQRLLRHRATQLRCSRVQYVGVLVMLLIASFVVTMACAIETIERAGDLSGWEFLVDNDWQSVNALYFSIVTVATVGFGDIAPRTALGRLCICVFIIMGAIAFSRMAAALIEVYQEPHAGLGAVHNAAGRLLVLLTGSPDRKQLCDVLEELYHPAHPNSAYLHVVSLLEGHAFSEQDSRWFTEHADYGHKFTYLRGSVFNPRDVARAVPGASTRGTSSHRLQAVFVLSSARGNDDEDTQNQLRAMALRRHLAPGTEIYVLLGSGDSQHSLQALGIPAGRILARDLVKSGFLAANTATPGAGPLLVNLFSSDGGSDAPIAERREVPRVVNRSWMHLRWLKKTASQSLNPEWLALRLRWREERSRRCFAPFSDDAMVQGLASSAAPSFAAAALPDHSTSRVYTDQASSSSAWVAPNLSRWWNAAESRLEKENRPAWHTDYEEGLEQELFQLSMPDFLTE